MKTNATGYYEGNLLMPGSYEVIAEYKGFKKMVRSGVTLPVSSRIQVDLSMEVGGVTEPVSVSGEAPLLETNAVSSGRVIDNKSLMELPVMGNSAMLLVKLAPGVQTGGVNNYLAVHSNAGGSDYNIGVNIGGNSWTLDGSPIQVPGRPPEAAEALPRSAAAAHTHPDWLNKDPDLKALREHPLYEKLRSKIKAAKSKSA